LRKGKINERIKLRKTNIFMQISWCRYKFKSNNGINEFRSKKYIDKLKKEKLYEKYRNLEDEEYEKLIKTEKLKKKYEKTKIKQQTNNEKTIEIITEKTKEIKDTYVKISVRTLMNFCYEKRIFR